MPTVTTALKESVDKNTRFDDGTNKAGNQWVWIPVANVSSMFTELVEESEIAITGGPSLSVVSGVATKYYSNSGVRGRRLL